MSYFFGGWESAAAERRKISPASRQIQGEEPCDQRHCRHRSAFAAAAQLAHAGALPFAARLVGAHDGAVLDAVNEVQPSGDPTAHAEISVLRRAAKDLGLEGLRRTTVYTAIEPCAMCAAARILAGVEQVVYAVGVDAVALHLDLPEDVVVPGVTGAAIFDSTAERPEVVGPILESEALSRIFEA